MRPVGAVTCAPKTSAVPAAEKLLVAKGWIAAGGDGRPTQKPRLPGIGTTTRVYVLTSKVWEDEE